MGQDRFRRMYWVLPYGGSLYIEGNENGETGLENFDMSKLGEEHCDRNLGGQGVFSPGLTRCLDEMKGPSGELPGHFRGFLGNQIIGSRADPSPMKLLMQHVSSQGKANNECSTSALKSPTQENRNHLVQASNHSVEDDHQNSAENRGAIATEDLSGPWFSLLPREPCDKSTITNCWMPTINTQHTPLDGSAPRRPGRPPKQPKTSEGESSTGVIKTAAQTDTVVTSQPVYQLPSLPRPLTLDEVRRSVMESLRQDPATIPKGLYVQ